MNIRSTELCRVTKKYSSVRSSSFLYTTHRHSILDMITMQKTGPYKIIRNNYRYIHGPLIESFQNCPSVFGSSWFISWFKTVFLLEKWPRLLTSIIMEVPNSFKHLYSENFDWKLVVIVFCLPWKHFDQNLQHDVLYWTIC